MNNWSKSNVERLLRKLILEGYLRETLIFVNDIAIAYLMTGFQINKLMNGDDCIQFAMEKSEAEKNKKNDLNLQENEPNSIASVNKGPKRKHSSDNTSNSKKKDNGSKKRKISQKPSTSTAN